MNLLDGELETREETRETWATGKERATIFIAGRMSIKARNAR